MRTALFLAVTQRVVAIYYRRFGKNLSVLTFEDGTEKLSRKLGKKLPLLAV
jgi:hypothetical protein